MMTLRALALLLGLVGCVQIFAQSTTAEAYFNQASKQYVKQDKMEALRTLDVALKQYPGDPRLLKLAEELVKEEQQQQKEQQQQEEQQEQEKKEQEKQKQEQAQKEKEQQEKGQEKKEQEQQGEEQQNAQQGEPKEEKGEPRAGTIAPQDAMRMLDALERSEKDVQQKVRVKLRPAVRRSIQKDW